MPYQHFKQIIKDMPANPGAEILRYGWQKTDMISLGQGEGSDPTPDFVNEAAFNAMKDGKTFYGPVLGQPALRDAIARYTKTIFKADLDTNRIFITGSGTTAMHLALTSILEEEDEVVAITPIWKNLLGAVHLAQAQTKQVPLDYNAETGWNLDINKLFDAVTPKTKAILVVTPSNPTGWCMSAVDMKALLDFAREKNIWIVSDEVYNRSTYNSDHSPSFVEFMKADDKVLIVNSFSKNWAMTGWRLGWLIGPAFAEPIIRDVALYDNMGPTTFNQFGGIAALDDGEPFIAAQKQKWQENRDFIHDWIDQKPNIQSQRPNSTFYSFFKVDGQEDCLEFAKRLIDEAGIGLAPGCAFGQNSKGWMRLCFAADKEIITQAVEKIEKVIK